MKTNETTDPVEFAQNVNLRQKVAQQRPVQSPVSPVAAPAQGHTQDEIELDLDRLIKFGVVERDFTIGGTVFKMRTLTEQERADTESLVPPDLVGDDEKTMNQRIAILKIPTLVRSIVQINSTRFDTDERKQRLAESLKKMQSSLVTQLFVNYLSLVNDQRQLFEAGLKKNSQ